MWQRAPPAAPLASAVSGSSSASSSWQPAAPLADAALSGSVTDGKPLEAVANKDDVDWTVEVALPLSAGPLRAPEHVVSRVEGEGFAALRVLNPLDIFGRGILQK